MPLFTGERCGPWASCSLNDFFSKNNYGMEIQNLFKSRGWFLKGPFEGQNIALIFGMEHPWDNEIQVFTNNVPVVINGPSQGGHSLI